MAGYRMYCVDGAGRIELAEWIEASSDEEAVLMARELRPHAQKAEVWHRNRMVAKLNEAGRFEQSGL